MSAAARESEPVKSRLPDFLVVGAMKAGTTTLFRDLHLHPQLYLPEDKEPESLCDDGIMTSGGRRDYSRLFGHVAADQLCGEASTAYTKLPDFTGVAPRAKKVLGHRLKVIYIVREPISRIVSHHYHEYALGMVEADINEVVRREHRFVNYSKYAMQISRWIECFGREQVGIWRFEDYVYDRIVTVREICAFLGVGPERARVREGRALNAGSAKRASNRFWDAAVIHNRAYKQWVKPYIPWALRDGMARVLLPKGPPRPSVLSEETYDFLQARLGADIEQLQALLRRSEPLWEPGTWHRA